MRFISKDDKMPRGHVTRCHGGRGDHRGHRGLQKTEYLNLDVSRCVACGKCVEACLSEVLEVRGIKFLVNHKHVHVVKPEACIGCLACLKVCPENVFSKNHDRGRVISRNR